MGKKFILFDNNGVLVDTEYWYYKATQKALGELGVVLNREQYMQIMIQGQSCWPLARARQINEKTIRQKQLDRTQYYQDYLKTKDIEIPGVEAILKEISRNFRMAIVTTSHRADFEVIHQNRPLLQYMDFALVREDYEKSKPNPEPFLLGLNRFGANPKDTLIVEDSERGLGAAIAAGIDCLIVENDFTRSHDFSKATYRINNLNELPKLLNGRI